MEDQSEDAMQEKEQPVTDPENAVLPSVRTAIGIVFLSFFVLTVVEFILWRAGLAEYKESYLAEALIIIPAFVYIRRRGIPATDAFRLRLSGPAIVGASLMIGAGTLVLTDAFDRLAGIFLPESDSLRVIEQEMRRAFSAETTGDWVLVILTVVIMAGVLEEMLFRGFLQRVLEREQEVTRAVMTSALIFAFFHYVWLIWPWAFVQFLLIGVIMGVTAWKTNSVFPAAIIHMLNNSAVLMFLNTGEFAIPGYEWRGQVAPWLLPLALLMTWYGFKLLYRAADTGGKSSQGTHIDFHA